MKANSVKQEYEKQDELKRSAMRAIAALLSVPGADKHPQLGDLITQIRWEHFGRMAIRWIFASDSYENAD